MPEGFAEFWEQYPRKQQKGQAIKTWRKLISPCNGDVAADIMEGLKTSPALRREPKDKIPHASTWLSGMGWLDDPACEDATARRDPSRPIQTQAKAKSAQDYRDQLDLTIKPEEWDEG